MQLANYNLSTNYRELWESAQRDEIVCIVDGQIAKTYIDDGYVEIGSKAYRFIWCRDKGPFIKQCQSCNLQWIVPEEAEIAKKNCGTCLSYGDRKAMMYECVNCLKEFYTTEVDYSNWRPKEREGGE